MEIREATELDIPEILKVLKASLGETSSKKTESVWRYKHIDNPFGKSLVLIALEDEKIIGVRAFMRWNWQLGSKIYSAFRAVDTATHPDHQGKGVFKKLTNKALEIAGNRGDHFVFNTPNEQSKPGYLKMGWVEVAKLKVELIPANPLHWTRKKTIEYHQQLANTFNPEIFLSWNRELESSGKIFTPKSEKYLQWRYRNNPLQEYNLIWKNDYFIAGYVKEHKRFTELRISELITASNADLNLIKMELKAWAKKFGVNIITIKAQKKDVKFSMAISGNFGPVLTFKKISPTLKEPPFLIVENWNYTLGDMELF